MFHFFSGVNCNSNFYNVINASVPVELSLEDSEQNKPFLFQKWALQPNKEYILRFNAEGKMLEEKSYAYL